MHATTKQRTNESKTIAVIISAFVVSLFELVAALGSSEGERDQIRVIET